MLRPGITIINNVTGEIYKVHNIMDDMCLIIDRGDKRYVRVDNIVWSIWST